MLYTWESLLDMDVITNGYILYDNYLLLLLVIYLGMSENGGISIKSGQIIMIHKPELRPPIFPLAGPLPANLN